MLAAVLPYHLPDQRPSTWVSRWPGAGRAVHTVSPIIHNTVPRLEANTTENISARRGGGRSHRLPQLVVPDTDRHRHGIVTLDWAPKHQRGEQRRKVEAVLDLQVPHTCRLDFVLLQTGSRSQCNAGNQVLLQLATSNSCAREPPGLTDDTLTPEAHLPVG